MELNKTAQQALFSELAKLKIETAPDPSYNGYSIDRYGYFENDLTTLLENFERELSDNLTNRPDSLHTYLLDIQKTILKLLNELLQYQKIEIHETLRYNPELFRENRLNYLNNFLNLQKETIYKVYDAIEQKLSVLSATNNSEFTEAVTAGAEGFPGFTPRLNSNLNRKDLTVLWWLLSECDFIPFDLQKDLASFLETNFRFKEEDETGVHYREMTSIAEFLSQLKRGEKVNPEASQIMIASKLRDRFEGFQNEILDVLRTHQLPESKK